MFSGRKWKCWFFKEHLQNLHAQRKTSPQIKWKGHGRSWLFRGQFTLECPMQWEGSEARHTTCLRHLEKQPPCPRTESNSFLTLKVSRHLLNISEEQEFRQKGNEPSPGTKMRFLLSVFPSDVFHRFSIAYQRQNSVLSSQLLSWWSNIGFQKINVPQLPTPNVCPIRPATPSTLYQTVMWNKRRPTKWEPPKAIYSELPIATESATINCILAETQRQK